MVRELLSKDSPIWTIITYIAVGYMAYYGVSHGYQEGWVARTDIPVILQIMAGLVGVDAIKFGVGKIEKRYNNEA